MKNSIAFIFLILISTCSLPVWSALVSVGASADTYITEYNAIGGSNSVNDTATSLYAITANGGNPAFRSYPLVSFDLSAIINKKVVGPATFEMFVQGTNFGFDSSKQVSVHEVLTDWDSTTLTFNTFGAAAGVQFGTDVGIELDSTSIIYPGVGNRYISWEIPQTVIQSWIDDPSTNNGLLLVNQELQNFTDLQFGSLESQNAPKLTFTSVSEPTIVLLLGAGLLLIGRRRRSC